MPAFFDPDDVPDDVRRDDAQERQRRQWRCPACRGGVGLHSQYCPEPDPEWVNPKGER